MKMNLKHTLLSATLAIATVIGSSSGTQAASVSYTSDTFTGVTPYSHDLSITKFDTSLGTLTGISITVSSQAAANIVVINFSGTSADPNGVASDQTYTNAAASSDVTVSTTVGSAASVTVTASTSGVSGTASTANGGINVLPGTMGPLTTSSAAVIAAGDFSLYEGSGSGSVLVNVAASAGTYGGTGNLVTFGGTTSVASYVTVTYEYTAADPPVAAVPEPTTSAMFGIGIVLAVGLGWGRRRRELNKLAV